MDDEVGPSSIDTEDDPGEGETTIEEELLFDLCCCCCCPDDDTDIPNCRPMHS